MLLVSIAWWWWWWIVAPVVWIVAPVVGVVSIVTPLVISPSLVVGVVAPVVVAPIVGVVASVVGVVAPVVSIAVSIPYDEKAEECESKEDAVARHFFNLFFFRLPCCCFPLSCSPSSDLSPYDSRLLKAGKLLIDIFKLLSPL